MHWLCLSEPNWVCRCVVSKYQTKCKASWTTQTAAPWLTVSLGTQRGVDEHIVNVHCYYLLCKVTNLGINCIGNRLGWWVRMLFGWLLSLAGAATCIIFVVTKVLSWQAHVCITKHVFCHDKSIFVVTDIFFATTNTSFVVTKVCLSWQKFCYDKVFVAITKKFLSQHVFVATNVCHDKSFVATKTRLSWQTYFFATKDVFCCNKTFIATQMILVAAPTNERLLALGWKGVGVGGGFICFI